MSDTKAQVSVLKQTVDPAVADAIVQLIETGEDHELNRINVLDFSRHTGLDEEKVIAGFLHASRLGLFDLTWNVLCPGCGGVLDAHGTLKSLRSDDYQCGLCACGYEPSVDEQVEVAFTVSPRTRRIGAHDPNTLPLWEYFKQVFWSRGSISTGRSLELLTDEVTLDALELPAGEKAQLSLQLPSAIHHRVRAGDALGPLHRRAGRADQGTPAAFADLQQCPRSGANHGDAARAAAAVARQPGRRAGAAVGVHRRRGAASLIGKRKPFLTAKRMLTNQTFRDVFKADNLSIDQRLKITSLTFLFTDLKGSTALYERSATSPRSIWCARISTRCWK